VEVEWIRRIIRFEIVVIITRIVSNDVLKKFNQAQLDLKVFAISLPQKVMLTSKAIKNDPKSDLKIYGGIMICKS